MGLKAKLMLSYGIRKYPTILKTKRYWMKGKQKRGALKFTLLNVLLINIYFNHNAMMGKFYGSNKSEY